MRCAVRRRKLDAESGEKAWKGPARRAAVERLAGRLKAAVDFGQVDELMSGGVAAFIADITKQCEQIHKALYSSYITYGAETVL